MDSDRSIPEPEVSVDVDPADRPPAQTSKGTSTAIAPRRILFWASAAGLVAGLASWLGGEAVYRTFEPVITHPPNWEQMDSRDRGALAAELYRINKPAAEARNAALTYG